MGGAGTRRRQNLHRLGWISDSRYETHKVGVFKRVRYSNVTKRFPYPDNTVDAVFTSHLLEHLSPPKAEFCLREVHRVRRPGGLLRVSVPDLDYLVGVYDSNDPSYFLEGVYGSTGSATTTSGTTTRRA